MKIAKALILWLPLVILTACSEPEIEYQEVVSPPLDSNSSIRAKPIDVSTTRDVFY